MKMIPEIVFDLQPEELQAKAVWSLESLNFVLELKLRLKIRRAPAASPCLKMTV